METERREIIINHYVESYNTCHVDGMLRDMADDVHFENISDGHVNVSIKGLDAFRKQAEEAITFFSGRQQIITSMIHQEDKTEVDIEYKAMLAVDLPNGLKKGDVLQMVGKSVFTFSETQITTLTDIS